MKEFLLFTIVTQLREKGVRIPKIVNLYARTVFINTHRKSKFQKNHCQI